MNIEDDFHSAYCTEPLPKWNIYSSINHRFDRASLRSRSWPFLTVGEGKEFDAVNLNFFIAQQQQFISTANHVHMVN